jgi:hypothetical protein
MSDLLFLREAIRESVDAALFDAEIGDSHPGCRARWRRIAMEAIDAVAWEATLPTVHINDGSAEARAMAWSEGYSEGFDAARAQDDTGLRECAHRRATPCVDRNGSCGTHSSPWPIPSPATRESTP